MKELSYKIYLNIKTTDWHILEFTIYGKILKFFQMLSNF